MYITLLQNKQNFLDRHCLFFGVIFSAEVDMDRKGLFIVKKGQKPDDGPLVIEVAGLFRDLDFLAVKKYSTTGFGGQQVICCSGSDESGYFILVAGGKVESEFFHSLMRHTISEGEFNPGVYLLSDCPGGQVLVPDHKITFKNLLEYAREDFPDLRNRFREFLEKNKRP